MTRIRRSEAQLDALAIADRRTSPYEMEHRTSMAIAWDASRRQPKDLREAEHFVRTAYAAEVPPKLHEMHQLADDGTPRMTARAVAYVFDDPIRTEVHDPDEALTFYRFPFRATLAGFALGDARQRDIAIIVEHVASGSSGRDAAIAQGVPGPWANEVASLALRAFLHWFSDVRVGPSRSSA